MTIAELIFLEVAPPGREPQVRALKGKVDNPYAVAWASYNDEANPNHGKNGQFAPGSAVAGHRGDGKTKQDVADAKTVKAAKPAKQKKAPKPKRAKKVRLSMDPILATMVEAELKAKKRNRLKKSSFAVPSERKFPIYDASHARNALARASGTKYEKQVRAAVHRKYPNIGKEEANSSGGLPQTLRGRKAEGGVSCADPVMHAMLRESVVGASYRFSEQAQITMANVTPEGPMVKCVLITEGLGNRADMHYYGAEAIEAGAVLFEGKPCFMDHQTKGEQQERPERTVRDKCGYFKNVRAERVDGRLGLVAELHYDLSETGRMAYDKACTAIHYKSEFPGSGEEYVGLSIAADGDLEERTVQVGDEILDVKYVTRFTAVGSVDEVTSPARGGRFVATLQR